MNEKFILFNEYYKQLYGVAIGYSPEPMFATNFPSSHEVIWLSNCPLEFKLKIYRRYTDDASMPFKNVQQVGNFMQYLNN